MTNGMWVQDFPLKSESNSDDDGSGSSGCSEFEDSLVDYLKHYSRNETATNGFCTKLKKFNEPLIFVRNYNPYEDIERIIRKVQLFDYSSANVVLIPSVPGRHSVSAEVASSSPAAATAGSTSVASSSTTSSSMNRNCALTIGEKYGYLRVRRAQDECRRIQHLHQKQNQSRNFGTSNSDRSDTSDTSDTKFVIQCSSIGSVGKDAKYLRELVEGLALVHVSPASDCGSFGVDVESWVQNSAGLQLIFPTVDTIRTAANGYSIGGCLPVRYESFYKGDKKTNQGVFPTTVGALTKDTNMATLANFLLPCYYTSLCKYDGSNVGRQLMPPHIKTYCQYLHYPRASVNTSISTSKGTELLWFCLTSSNLSQAAWGVMTGSGTKKSRTYRLYIKSYELGVLFLPTAQHMNLKNEGSSVSVSVGRTFSCTPAHPILGLDHVSNSSVSTCASASASEAFKMNERVLYIKNGEERPCVIKEVHRDDAPKWYFTICFNDGSEKQTVELYLKHVGGLQREGGGGSGGSGGSGDNVCVRFYSSATATSSSTVTSNGSGRVTEHSVYFPVPYRLPPHRYAHPPYGNDEPWTVDLPNKRLPDCTGRFNN
jgi:hypothetical protein